MIATRSDEASDTLRALEAAGGGAAAATGAVTGKSALQRLIESIRNPNRDIGFTYGDWSQIGAGHKTPAQNIQKILQRAIDNLPEGDPNKKIRMFDIRRTAEGLERTNLGRNLNMLYNTGLGLGRPGAGAEWTAAYDRELAKELGKTQSIRRYMTDLPSGGSVGATGTEEGLLRGEMNGKRIGGKRVLDNKLITYGSDNPEDYPDFIRKKRLHVGNTHGGSPFIDPDYVDSLKKINSKDKVLGRLEEYVSGKREGLTPEARKSLSDVLARVKSGQKLVTIAGSGRGDYMAGRLIPSLESADRFGLGRGKVTFAPLLANYVPGSPEATSQVGQAFAKMDPHGRVVPFGRLPGDAYAALQRLADTNMASTGTMAISEAANNGNLNAIPRNWNDLNSSGWDRMNAKKDIIRGLTGKDVDPGMVNLDSWNRGNIDHMIDGNRSQLPNRAFLETNSRMNPSSEILHRFTTPESETGISLRQLKNSPTS